MKNNYSSNIHNLQPSSSSTAYSSLSKSPASIDARFNLLINGATKIKSLPLGQSSINVQRPKNYSTSKGNSNSKSRGSAKDLHQSHGNTSEILKNYNESHNQIQVNSSIQSEISSYVKQFQKEIEQKFTASQMNQNYRFEKDGESDSSFDDSLASLENITTYDLASQNKTYLNKNQNFLENIEENIKKNPSCEGKKTKILNNKILHDFDKEYNNQKNNKSSISFKENNKNMFVDTSITEATNVLESLKALDEDELEKNLSDKNSALYKALYKMVEKNLGSGQNLSSNENNNKKIIVSDQNNSSNKNITLLNNHQLSKKNLCQRPISVHKNRVNISNTSDHQYKDHSKSSLNCIKEKILKNALTAASATSNSTKILNKNYSIKPRDGSPSINLNLTSKNEQLKLGNTVNNFTKNGCDQEEVRPAILVDKYKFKGTIGKSQNIPKGVLSAGIKNVLTPKNNCNSMYKSNTREHLKDASLLGNYKSQNQNLSCLNVTKNNLTGFGRGESNTSLISPTGLIKSIAFQQKKEKDNDKRTNFENVNPKLLSKISGISMVKGGRTPMCMKREDQNIERYTKNEKTNESLSNNTLKFESKMKESRSKSPTMCSHKNKENLFLYTSSTSIQSQLKLFQQIPNSILSPQFKSNGKMKTTIDSVKK